MHDSKFNHWKHPFEEDQSGEKDNKKQLSREEISKLVKFKDYVQGKMKGRVPAIVEQYLKV